MAPLIVIPGFFKRSKQEGRVRLAQLDKADICNVVETVRRS
jgi:hypothetical protein